MFSSVRRHSLELKLFLTLGQISSWWSGPKPANESCPYDPTDPKQNPLNPKGLKPYVSIPVIGLNLPDPSTAAAHVRTPNDLEMTVF
jgi:hypothetical protein